MVDKNHLMTSLLLLHIESYKMCPLTYKLLFSMLRLAMYFSSVNNILAASVGITYAAPISNCKINNIDLASFFFFFRLRAHRRFLARC